MDGQPNATSREWEGVTPWLNNHTGDVAGLEEEMQRTMAALIARTEQVLTVLVLPEPITKGQDVKATEEKETQEVSAEGLARQGDVAFHSLRHMLRETTEELDSKLGQVLRAVAGKEGG